MSGGHSIEKAQLEISFGSEEEAFRQQAGIDSMVKKLLLPVVEEVFDECAEEGMVIRLDQLEVDLGPIQLADYPAEFAPRLKRKLYEALLEKIATLKTHNGYGEGKIPEPKAPFEQLSCFLSKGVLPWHGKLAEAELDSLFEQVLRYDSNRLVDFFRRSLKKRTVLDRLVRQFSDGSLIALVQELVASQIDVEDRLVAALKRTPLSLNQWRGLIQVLLAQTSPKVVGGLDNCLASSGNISGKKQLKLLLAKALSADEPPRRQKEAWKKHQQILQNGEQIPEEPGGDSSVKSEMPQVLKERSGSLGGGMPQEKSDQDQVEISDPIEKQTKILPEREQCKANKRYTVLRYLLAQGVLPHGYEKNALAFIERLAKSHPEVVRRLSKDLKSEDICFEREIAVLPAEYLQKLVEVIGQKSLSSDADGGGELVEDIRTWAPRARNNRKYFSGLLECLLQGEVINFEELTKGHDLSSGTERTDLMPAIGGGYRKPPVKILEQGLRLEKPFSADEEVRILSLFQMTMEAQPAALRHLMVTIFGEEKPRARLIDLLPENLLTPLLPLVFEDQKEKVQHAMDVVVRTCNTLGGAGDFEAIRKLKWDFLILLFRDDLQAITGQSLVTRFKAFLEQSGVSTDRNSHQIFRGAKSQVSKPVTSERYESESFREYGLLEGKENQAHTSARSSLTSGAEEEAPLDEIYIANAGAVLTSAYLPRLFSMWGLLEGGGFIDRQAAEKAIHLIQFLVDSRTDAPEYQLVLNKILCGVQTAAPIAREVILTEEERQVGEGLLQGMIQNWKAIGNASVAGLREAFLQREGALSLKDDAWHLLVEPKAYDMLLDTLPWGISPIRHPWMDRVVYVEWR